MEKAFFKKYIELMLATVSASLLACVLFWLLMIIPPIGKRFPNGLEFAGIGIVVPIIFLLFLFFGCFELARRWTAREKAGVSTAYHWHNVLQLIIAAGVAFLTFAYVYLFFNTSMYQPTNSISNKTSFYLKHYPFILRGVSILCLLPAFFVIIKKTRKMGARWCLLLSTAILMQNVLDPSASMSMANYLFFSFFFVPCAILLMAERLPETLVIKKGDSYPEN
jgi:uncharacterized membrane protein YhaH (DUF805 family)